MPAIDKAVSTEDLCAEEVPPALGVLRLEAIINTLVENKVEALKQENGNSSSLYSSPKNILQKLKCQSSPKTTLTIEDEKQNVQKKKDCKDKNHGHKVVLESRQFKKQMLRQETSSPDSQILQCTVGHQYRSASCVEATYPSPVCYCNQGLTSTQMTDDYISIKMDGYGDIETDAIIAQEELKRAKRKRRRRRKRRLKKRLALNSHLVDTLGHESEFKALNDDELPPRAKWTIVATACLLFFMCLLLVGITLRMAPIIDEIGQKHLQKTTSLEEIYRKNYKKQRKREHKQRRKSEFCLRESDVSLYRKRPSKKLSRKCTTTSTKGCCAYDIKKGYLEVGLPSRTRTVSESDSVKMARRQSRQLSLQKEESMRHRRKRKILKIILGIYLLLFCISILCVVVTLTHTSTASVVDKNFTRNFTYYTFSPNPDVVYEENR